MQSYSQNFHSIVLKFLSYFDILFSYTSDLLDQPKTDFKETLKYRLRFLTVTQNSHYSKKKSMDAHSFHVFKYSNGCHFVRFFIFQVKNLNSDLSSFKLVTLKLMSHYFNQLNQTLINTFVNGQFLSSGPVSEGLDSPKSVWS